MTVHELHFSKKSHEERRLSRSSGTCNDIQSTNHKLHIDIDKLERLGGIVGFLQRRFCSPCERCMLYRYLRFNFSRPAIVQLDILVGLLFIHEILHPINGHFRFLNVCNHIGKLVKWNPQQGEHGQCWKGNRGH